MKQNKLIGSCPCLKNVFWDKNALILYIFLLYRMYFFENKAYKLNLFDIESKQKHLKMFNTDRKENKNINK